jgi:predicted nucleotidyltransferase
LFDIEFTEGEFIAKEVVRTTMLHIKIPQAPIFTLDKEGFLQKVYGLAGFEDIHIENHKDFSKRFYLLGDDENAVKKFFNDELVHFFESNPYFHIESNGNSLLIFDKERLASIREIKGLLDFGKRLQMILNKNIS